MFYTIQFQNNIKNTEAVLSRDSSFLRYYIFNIDDTSTILGTISIKKCSPSTQTSVRIGYKIDEKECNQGFAYEALSFLIPRIFLSGITQQLEAIVCPTNIASIHLLSKLGFILDPTRSISCQLKQGTLTHHIYCLHSGISVTNMHQ